jgi:hypothetical protein
MLKNSQGMSLVEVAVSGGLLAVFLYGILNFSNFAARMNQSNRKSADFSTIMSTITNMIKTPSCDALLSGLIFDDSPAQVGVPQSFSGLNSVGGFTLASPSPAPGFALTDVVAGEPPSFQLTLIKPAVDSIAGTQLVQDTVDLQISLKKVDSTGKPLPGANFESKDFTLNLWVDHSVSPAHFIANTCTLKNPLVYAAPIVNPTCVLPGAQVTVTWNQESGSTPTLSNNWGAPLPPLTSSSSSAVLSVPSPLPNSNLIVRLTETNALGNTSPPLSSLPFASYPSPTISAFFSPLTFATLPNNSPALHWSVTGMGGARGQIMLTAPALLPLSGPGIPSPIPPITSAYPGQMFPYTVMVKNPCGISATSSAWIRYAQPSPSPSVSP